MATFDIFLKEVRDGLEDLAKNMLVNFKDQAIQDGEDFVEKSKGLLQTWIKQLAHKQMSEDQFACLVRGRKTVMKMHLLKQKGLAIVKAEKFRDSFLDLIIAAAFKCFP